MVENRAVQHAIFRGVGAAGLVGCAAAMLTTIAAVLAQEGAGFAANTISALAAGRQAWIQDLGLYAFGAAMIAVTVALGWYREDPKRGWHWRVGLSLLGACGGAILLVGAYGEYGDRDPGGLVIHIYVVFFTLLAFVSGILLTAPALRPHWRHWMAFSVTIAAILVAAVPVFFFVPTGWDGLFQRAAAMMMVIWLAAVSLLMMRWPRDSAT